MFALFTLVLMSTLENVCQQIKAMVQKYLSSNLDQTTVQVRTCTNSVPTARTIAEQYYKDITRQGHRKVNSIAPQDLVQNYLTVSLIDRTLNKAAHNNGQLC